MNAGFLIDTNVLSELMRPAPSTPVLDWFAAQSPSQLYTCVVTYAEILAGIALLPAGKRRDALAANLQLVTRNTKDFAGIEGLTLVNPWQAH